MMKYLSPLTLFTFITCTACKTEAPVKSKQEYLRWVGDIEHESGIDDSSFTICNGEQQVLQYFNMSKGPLYSGEKSTLIETFKAKYKPPANSTQSGFIRIRFIVNCQGKAGRHRLLQADRNYKKTEFEEKLVSQLLNITEQIEDWPIHTRNEVAVDYYMYLIFKIQNGQLIEILP